MVEAPDEPAVPRQRFRAAFLAGWKPPHDHHADGVQGSVGNMALLSVAYQTQERLGAE